MEENAFIFSQEAISFLYLSGDKRIPESKKYGCFEAIYARSQVLVSEKVFNYSPKIVLHMQKKQMVI